MDSTPTPERSRRFALIVGVIAVVLLVLVLASLFGTCREGDEGTSEQVAPPEELGPTPGVE